MKHLRFRVTISTSTQNTHNMYYLIILFHLITCLVGYFSTNVSQNDFDVFACHRFEGMTEC